MNWCRCQREADEDDQIDSQEQQSMLDAERMLTLTQNSISKQGAENRELVLLWRLVVRKRTRLPTGSNGGSVVQVPEGGGRG